MHKLYWSKIGTKNYRQKQKELMLNIVQLDLPSNIQLIRFYKLI